MLFRPLKPHWEVVYVSDSTRGDNRKRHGLGGLLYHVDWNSDESVPHRPCIKEPLINESLILFRDYNRQMVIKDA
ncbi:MAG TPA: hypothetical protein VIH42_03660 [Thermoguttaceae bacterium]